ncbi:MAG: hypothetical protein PWP59_1188 [Sphaerochaeta sp.]|jgi:hypothetical protein|nr:hypothetical protein [Sphaerochaeta sp.]
MIESTKTIESSLNVSTLYASPGLIAGESLTKGKKL